MIRRASSSVYPIGRASEWKDIPRPVRGRSSGPPFANTPIRRQAASSLRSEADTRCNQKWMRQEAHGAIERLEPRDLFAVWIIVGALTRMDEPPAKLLKKG